MAKLIAVGLLESGPPRMRPQDLTMAKTGANKISVLLEAGGTSNRLGRDKPDGYLLGS